MTRDEAIAEIAEILHRYQAIAERAVAQLSDEPDEGV